LDTALCIEAISAYFQASGEAWRDLNLNVLLDGQIRKSVRITAADLFSYESTLDLGPGQLRPTALTPWSSAKPAKDRSTTTPISTNFTKEDPIAAAGLEVKIDRTYWRLTPKDGTVLASGSRGQIINQPSEAFNRERIEPGAILKIRGHHRGGTDRREQE